MSGLPSLSRLAGPAFSTSFHPNSAFPPRPQAAFRQTFDRGKTCPQQAGRPANTVVMLARPRSVSFVSQQNCLTFFRLAPSFMTRTQGEAVAAEGLPAAAICSGIVEHVKKAAGASQHVRCLEYSSTVVQSTLYSRECICPCYMSIDSPMRPLTSCEGG